ncbi:MAG: ankyrin repeat domain-containing protein [Gammaproteobacteria bacterium]|nr:ankyrin repeat domain-containing protein [Gammaproteobacteria bacterium]
MPRIIYLLTLSAILMGCGQESNQPEETSTPALISAAESGDLATLKQLLQQQQADVYDSCQWTPLMKASLNGHREVAEQLLFSQASIDLSDKRGYTALMLAASNNHWELVELLLRQGADINHVELTQGWTALIWSAKRGHLDTVRVLLDQGANTTIKDHQGKTARDWALSNKHINISQMISGS